MWWGGSKAFESGVGNRTNRLIISFYDKHYIDIGYGGARGADYGTVERWEGMFELDYAYPRLKGQVLGAVVTLWSEVSDDWTASQRIWPRSCAMAERTWNGATYYPGYDRMAVLRRLNAHGQRLRSRGVAVTPLADQLCEAKGICD